MTIKCDAAFDAAKLQRLQQGDGLTLSPQFESSVERARGTRDQRPEEGSGISRNNRLTARGLRPAVPPFRAPRRRAPRTRWRANKTGTHPGVRTLAGYADTSKHRRVRFLISLRSNKARCVSGCSGPSNPGYSRSLAHRVDGPNTLVRVTRGADRFRLIAAPWLVGSGRGHPRPFSGLLLQTKHVW